MEKHWYRALKLWFQIPFGAIFFLIIGCFIFNEIIPIKMPTTAVPIVEYVKRYFSRRSKFFGSKFVINKDFEIVSSGPVILRTRLRWCIWKQTGLEYDSSVFETQLVQSFSVT